MQASSLHGRKRCCAGGVPSEAGEKAPRERERDMKRNSRGSQKDNRRGARRRALGDLRHNGTRQLLEQELQRSRPEVKVAVIRKTRIRIEGGTERPDDKFSKVDLHMKTKPPSHGVQRRRKTKIHPSRIRGRGQLRLSITAEASQLVIRIHEARGLMAKTSRSCDSQVRLTSDINRNIVMKTPTVNNNKNPEYNHQFLLPISENVHQKRLTLSVLRRHTESSEKKGCQLIGCMSFRIGPLISSRKLVDGWFYLLGAEFGWRKHLRVTTQTIRTMTSPSRWPELCTAGASDSAATLSHPKRFTDPPPKTIRLPGPAESGTACRDAERNVATDADRDGKRDGDRDAKRGTERDANLGAGTQLTVSVIRGQDGFGFTICCDSPVRVQSVDAGGPAHQSGLRQGDAVLQLNGLPVEIWKCGELAHAIRSCPNHIVLVVWRGSPEVRTCCETLHHPPAASKTTKLLHQPAHTKHGRRRRDRGSVVSSSLEVLGSLWRDRKEEEHEQGKEGEEGRGGEEEPPCTSTLKGTCVTSSNGDNYIILSPAAPQEQIVRPVFEDRSTTIGRLYQTHPRRGVNLLDEGQVGSPPQALTHWPMGSAAPPGLSCAFSSTLRNYGTHGTHQNYQNCTIIQSHRPSCGIGEAPKTLIFPIFVEPVDLCSPDRALQMSEEMLLHQAQQLPRKVTVLIYDDVLLVSREDHAGRCHVLKSPLYFNTLQIQEVASAPHHIFFLQSSVSCWQCLFSLEAFSLEQKVRVGLRLRDNIQRQLVAKETGHSQQLLASPSELGLFLSRLSSPSSHPPFPSPCDAPAQLAAPPCLALATSACAPARPPSPPPSSRPALSPVWKGRGEEEEKEERRRHQEDLSSTSKAEGLRRCASEGSLRAQPESTRSLSDSTIHRLTFDLHARPASTQTLRKHLTSEGVTLTHTLAWLRGGKDLESGNDLKKKSKTFASEVRSRLPFLCRRKRLVQSDSLERALRNTRPSAREVLVWAESLKALLANQYGLAVFRHFLRSEYSEENLDFWLAAEKFKQTCPLGKMADRAKKIYEEFISCGASRQVNVDSNVRELTQRSLRLGAETASFQLAQDQIFSLMEADSYPRFLRSRLYAQLANQDAGLADNGQADSAQTLGQNRTREVLIM
ncbi:regulator of G-protein signaling 3-like isoform X2 [Hippocampus zosterae]|uniref:regulator of G-protein signaling 3-like isoform X2 n=1 Tax=Hippocampus zosterae TaxID=109293 RepID=UPI00223DB2B2|nr:regulator of G-protein signaling 3-like isoform X2 [Hippocampus zosterae]